MIWLRILVLVYWTSCKVLRTDYIRLRNPSRKALCQNSCWTQIRKSLNGCYRILLSALESSKWSEVSRSVMSTLGNSMDCGPPGSSVHGILQARILKRFPFPSPRIFQTQNWTQVSCIAGRFFTVWAYFLYYNFFSIMIIYIKLDKWTNSLCIWVTIFIAHFIQLLIK